MLWDAEGPQLISMSVGGSMGDRRNAVIDYPYDMDIQIIGYNAYK